MRCNGSSTYWILTDIRFCVMAALFLLGPVTISSNCDPYQRFYGYSFIRTDLIEEGQGAIPYPIAFRQLYDTYALRDSVQQVDNIDEWHERFCRRPRRADMEALIYRSSVYDLQQLRTAIMSPDIPVPPDLADNSFARYLRRNQCTEAVDYLIYAKRCEPYVVRRAAWEEQERNGEAMQDLIQEGLQRFLSIESHYFRLRTAYQMIRLAHYAGRYEQVLELYDYTMPKTDNDPSLIEYWIEGHRAGALQALGQRPEANYLYLRNFLYCPSRRLTALQSLRVRSQREWEATERLCRDERERATLYAMRAYADNSRTVEEMETIFLLDPMNPELEPLLVKEMTELERDLLGLNFNPRKSANLRQFKRPREDAGKIVLDLQGFVRRLADDVRRPNRSLWMIAEGYLEVIAGDFYGAQRTFQEARELVDDPTLEAQLQAFEMVLYICSLDEINDEVEEEVARLRRSRLFEAYPDFQRLLTDKLQELYRLNDMPGKLFITRYPINLLRPNPREAIVEDLLRLTEKDGPNRLEVQMLQGPDGRPYRRDLLDMEAVNYMQENQLAAALQTLKEFSRSRWDDFGRWNPFVERLSDCVHCPLPDSLEMYTRGEILERILDLQYEARSEPELRAINNYRIGIALYNMTYYSHAWGAMDYFRSGASARARFEQPGDNVFPYPGFPLGNREHFDCEPARFYFEQAREAAESDELRARATFWEAKCARNAFFADRSRGLEEFYNLYDELIDNSSQTRYYARIIEECQTFAAYVAGSSLGE